MFTVNGNTNYTLYLLMNIFLFQDNLGEKEIFNLLYCTVSSFAANHCSFLAQVLISNFRNVSFALSVVKITAYTTALAFGH